MDTLTCGHANAGLRGPNGECMMPRCNGTQRNTDMTGIYSDSPAEREERDATMAGMFGESDEPVIFEFEDDAREYAKELAYFSQDPNLIYF